MKTSSYVVKPLSTWRLERRYPDGKKIALITGAGLSGLRILTEDGRAMVARNQRSAINLLRKFAAEKWIIYSLAAPLDVTRATNPQLWTGYKRQQGGTYYKFVMDDGPSIIPLRQNYDIPDDEAMQGLLNLLYALEDYGVMPNSIGTMSFHLWRSCLTNEVAFSGPAIARRALYGGRQECPYPGDYKEADYYDLSAAYPFSMAREPFSTRLVRDRIANFSAPVGIANAIIHIDERLSWHPIPTRLVTDKPWYTYGHGRAEGWWTFRELQLAKDEGCEITLSESWSGRAHFEDDIFAEWWSRAQLLRALPGFAGVLAKVLTSQLWGKFSLRASAVGTYRWSDELALETKCVSLTQTPRGMPQDASSFISADITARVRETLWYEGLKNPSAIYCDTDAVIVNKGTSPGPRWRSKLENGSGLIEICGPQMFRWECNDCRNGSHIPWHYVVAGAKNRDLQVKMFERRNRTVAMNPTWGMTFPAANIKKLRERLLRGNDNHGRARATLEQTLRVARERGVQIR